MQIMMKGSLRTSGECVKVNRRVCAFPGRGQVPKLLFRITPPWIKNGQSEGIHVVRSYNLTPIENVSARH
jgi:hypothetical protein